MFVKHLEQCAQHVVSATVDYHLLLAMTECLAAIVFFNPHNNLER